MSENSVHAILDHLQRLTKDKPTMPAAEHPGFNRLVNAELMDGNTEVSRLYEISRRLPGNIMKTVYVETMTDQGLEAAKAHKDLVVPVMGMIQVRLYPDERAALYPYYHALIMVENERRLSLSLDQQSSPVDYALTGATTAELDRWNIGQTWIIDDERASLKIAAKLSMISAIESYLADLA